MDIQAMIQRDYEATGYYLYKGSPMRNGRIPKIWGVDKKDILSQATKELKKYPNIIGARVQITCEKSLDLSTINEGIFYNNEEVEDVYIGDLTEEQKQYLSSLLI